MEIKKARPSDSQELARMNYRLIRDEKSRNRMNKTQLTRRMTKWLKDGYTAFIFRAHDQIVGYCLIRKEPEFVYIRQFYIERGFRRSGLGREAFSALLAEFSKFKTPLRIDVLVGNQVGISFWKALRFRNYCITMERK